MAPDSTSAKYFSSPKPRDSTDPDASVHRLKTVHTMRQALAASQGAEGERHRDGKSAARGLQVYWSCCLGEHVLDVFVAKFSQSLGPGSVDIVALGERTLFTLREQGTVRVQKVLGYQPSCGCKYAVVAAPGEEGEGLTGTTVHESNEGFATVLEEENIIIAADTNHLMVYKVKEPRGGSYPVWVEGYLPSSRGSRALWLTDVLVMTSSSGQTFEVWLW